MPGGSPLSVFNDFMGRTGPAVLTSPEQFINEASKRNYLLGRFLDTAPMAEMIQGGKTITDHILKDDASTFQNYQPNDTFTWQNPQVMTDWEVNWRYSIDHMAWTEQEILHQVGDGMTQRARFQKYKDMKRVKEARLWTSVNNGMEDALFAQPSNTAMEAADGTDPYSLIAYINEDTNGLYGNFTTLMGINPVTDPYWVPNQIQYDAADPDDTDGDRDGLWNAFDEMRYKMNYKPPPKQSQYFDQHYNQRFICTGITGALLYEDLLRKKNERLINYQDPAYAKPQYAGYDIEEVDTLETIEVYPGASGTTRVAFNAGTVDNSGPRFYFICTEYMRMVFHRDRYFYKRDVAEHPNQPGTYRQPINVWRNLICRSRRRGTGIIYPGA